MQELLKALLKAKEEDVPLSYVTLDIMFEDNSSLQKEMADVIKQERGLLVDNSTCLTVLNTSSDEENAPA